MSKPTNADFVFVEVTKTFMMTQAQARKLVRVARLIYWPNWPEAAYLGFGRNVRGTFQPCAFRRYSTTSSTGNLKPRPSATRSTLIGYFGRLGLIAVMRKISPRARKVRP